MHWQMLPAQWRTRPFRAMGCQMAVWLELGSAARAEPLLREAEAMFARAERCLSRFDAASELSQLNARPGIWTPVSGMLWQVILQALFMARETGGLFDPTLLSALEAAGYDRSFEKLADHRRGEAAEAGEPLAGSAPAFGQWQSIRLNADGQAVWLPPGVRLDLGGIAKGYTAQQVADFLSDWGACLVDASGDLTAGAAPDGWPGWPVAVSAPFRRPDERRSELFPLWLVEGTMATSGIDYRRWQQNGRAAHHVIDPRSGRPAVTDLLTVTVLAKTAVRAEAWATASLVAGTAVAQQRLTALNLAAALIDDSGSISFTPALEPFVALAVNETPQG